MHQPTSQRSRAQSRVKFGLEHGGTKNTIYAYTDVTIFVTNSEEIPAMREAFRYKATSVPKVNIGKNGGH
jgi:hypothetical protein